MPSTFGRREVPLHAAHVDIDGTAIERRDHHAAGTQLGHAVVVEDDDVPGVGQKGGDVAGQQRGAVGQSDHERRATTGLHHQITLVG